MASNRETLPVITHIQWAIINELRGLGGKASATQLRKAMADTWCAKGPAFYQAMNRLARIGAVVYRHIEVEVCGGTVTRTEYSVTAAGLEASAEVIDFYRSRGV